MDIALFFNTGAPNADIAISGLDVKINQDLESAVIISLFANRLSQPGDPIDGTDRQGWWGDTFATVNGIQIGSRLWELKRSKSLQSVVTLARQYCLEALQWLIEDQVADTVGVQCELIDKYTLGIAVQIYKPNNFTNFKFAYVWSQL